MATGIAAAPSASADDSSTVVAEVNGHQLTRADLEKRESGDLLQAKYKYYLVERQAVDQLVDDQLLSDQAEKEHVSVEELLKRHADNTVKDPTEDQLEIFYEGIGSDKPYAEMRPQILDHIRSLRRQKARTAYLDSLKKKGDVRVMLESPMVAVAADNSPSLGPANAPVKIIEFADFQCPYCKQMHPELKKLQEEFPNKTILTYKDFPLAMHQNAEKAAEAAHCAGDQGKFWEYHDAIFESSAPLDIANLKEMSKSLKLDQAAFDKCLDSGKQAATVAKGFEEGKKLGITGTPTIFINGHVVSGAAKYDTLKELVEQQAGAAPGPQAKLNDPVQANN